MRLAQRTSPFANEGEDAPDVGDVTEGAESDPGSYDTVFDGQTGGQPMQHDDGPAEEDPGSYDTVFEGRTGGQPMQHDDGHWEEDPGSYDTVFDGRTGGQPMQHDDGPPQDDPGSYDHVIEGRSGGRSMQQEDTHKGFDWDVAGKVAGKAVEVAVKVVDNQRSAPAPAPGQPPRPRDPRPSQPRPQPLHQGSWSPDLQYFQGDLVELDGKHYRWTRRSPTPDSGPFAPRPGRDEGWIEVKAEGEKKGGGLGWLAAVALVLLGLS